MDDRLIDRATSEVGDDHPRMTGPGAPSAEQVDSFVVAETIEAVEARRRPVGDHTAAGSEGGDSAPLAKTLRGGGHADDAGADPVEYPDVEESSFAVPGDAESAQILAGGDAVVVVKVLEQFPHDPRWAPEDRLRGTGRAYRPRNSTRVSAEELDGLIGRGTRLCPGRSRGSCAPRSGCPPCGTTQRTTPVPP